MIANSDSAAVPTQNSESTKSLEFEIRVGDSIRVSSELKEIYEKTGRTGAMIFAVIRSS